MITYAGNLRMWRNWQTRRSQTPVDIASLWVQVPSSAPKAPLPKGAFYFFSNAIINQTLIKLCSDDIIYL